MPESTNTAFTIELTPVQLKSMEYVSTDPAEWIRGAVHERARLAMEELVADEVRAKLAAGGVISGTKEEIAMASELPNAAQRNEAMMALATAGLPMPPQPNP